LKIEGDKTKRCVQVKVKDNGNGFPQKDAGKIFNTFTRLNNKPPLRICHGF
jgi:K+-sensing histidine kinase KdpD